MATSYELAIDELLDSAEREQQCLARPEDPRLRRALSYRASRDRFGGGNYLSPHPGIYAHRDYWESLTKTDQVLHAARALSKLHPTWTFDGYTSATVRGWSVSYSLLDDIRIASPYHYRSSDLISRTIKDVAFEMVDGIRVTPIAQTLYECLRATDLRQTLPIADSALRQLRMTKDELAKMLASDQEIGKRRFLKHALSVLHYADPLSESGGESIARATMIMLGFTIPELQVEYPDPMNPGKCIRVDFRWVLKDGTVILGEFDGKQKYTDETMTNGKSAIEVLAAERLRESRLSITGARIVRFSYDDVRDVVYFAHLLESYGVPRDISKASLSSSFTVALPSAEAYDEIPPLDCYEDLLQEYRYERFYCF